MKTDTLFKELNRLWEPIRPFLTRQIQELYGRQDGNILEIGPFSGLIFALAQKKVGQSFSIAAFPQGAIRMYREEARKHGLEDRVRIIESDSSLLGIADDTVDLAIFRGALFFPTLFRVDLEAIHRALRTGGIAFVGGGFGMYTPAEVISKIGKRSEEINASMGRVRVSVESVREQLRLSSLDGKCEIATEGGLWVVMKK
jgi:SAM-dependent methyltransferase